MADDLAAAAAPSSDLQPEELLVEGAGEEAVNGTYSLVSIFNDRGWYKKHGFYNGKQQTFSLYRYTSLDGLIFWCISIVPPEVEPGTQDEDGNYREIDFYCRGEPNITSSSHPPMHGWESDAEGQEPPPTVRLVDAALPAHGILLTSCIMNPVTSVYEKILLSDDFSDVQLVCEDKVLPAHKVVLAAASSYFKALFSGPWKENDKGKVNISHSSSVVEAVLKMLYTGIVDAIAVKEDPLSFLKIASEFDLPWLKEVSENGCLESINEDNLKGIWQAARAYDSDMLKGHCVEYAKSNAVSVLANGGITDLRAEDPPSWDEFASSISNKKARYE